MAPVKPYWLVVLKGSGNTGEMFKLHLVAHRNLVTLAGIRLVQNSASTLNISARVLRQALMGVRTSLPVEGERAARIGYSTWYRWR